MTVKALRKQLMAAIAMVVVAAVALSSSTYAWFAQNNSVKADISSIVATSNAAFLEITNEWDEATSRPKWSNKTQVQINSADAVGLLPSKPKTGEEATPTFQTGFASSPDASDITSAGLSDVRADELSKYAYKTTVYIRAQSGKYKDIILDAASISAVNGSSSLVSAGRILAIVKDSTGSSGAATYSINGNSVDNDTKLYTGELTGETYATIDLYFYYDGDDTNVYTNNIENLTAIKSTVTFNATQVVE